MSTPKVRSRREKSNPQPIDGYDHYIAIDWSEKIMAIARMTKKQTEPIVFERPTDLHELKEYLKALPGKKVLALEETTTAHWLFLELYEYVDRIIVCDPYRNRLLSDGPKTDKIDASKLCRLLRAGLLKEVFHNLENDFQLRKMISAYNDIVKAGVRSLNQRAALYRAEGKHQSETFTNPQMKFILGHYDSAIARYEETKAAYAEQFEHLCKKDKRIRNQKTISGIGPIGAVKIVAIVVDPRRFERAGKYLSYCGLVKLQKISGQRSYGQRTPRYNRQLKAIYKTAAISALAGDGPLREYYDALRAKGIADHNARNAVARQIAKISYGMLKNGTSYQPYRWRQSLEKTTKACA
jgi:transposase